MILDTLDNATRYFALGERIATALKYLRDNDCTKLPVGKISIQGEQIYALVQDNTTKTRDQGVWEAHRKYIDVQFVQSGRETILWAPLASMREETLAYDEKKDVALWKLVPDVTPVHLSAGHFVILFPADAHAPTVVWDTPTEVFKVVVKVKVA